MTLMEVLMNKKTALEFFNKINAHDVDGIIRYISGDHVLIDAQNLAHPKTFSM